LHNTNALSQDLPFNFQTELQQLYLSRVNYKQLRLPAVGPATKQTLFTCFQTTVSFNPNLAWTHRHSNVVAVLLCRPCSLYVFILCCFFSCDDARAAVVIFKDQHPKHNLAQNAAHFLLQPLLFPLIPHVADFGSFRIGFPKTGMYLDSNSTLLIKVVPEQRVVTQNRSNEML
jgi:hypothetical protein